MHHGAGERAVGAGPDQHRQIRLLHGRIHVDIDDRDLGATLFAGARRMRHHIDLGVGRIGPPDHDQVGLRHLARIGSGKLSRAGNEAGERRIDADRGKEAGIFLGMAQAMDAIAHDVTHRAGVEIRPDGLRTVLAFGARELFGHDVERVVPGNRRKLAAAFSADTAQRVLQPVGVMYALGIARYFGADDPRRVGIIPRAAYAADRMIVKDLDFQGAGRRAVVRAGRSANLSRADKLVHR